VFPRDARGAFFALPVCIPKNQAKNICEKLRISAAHRHFVVYIIF